VPVKYLPATEVKNRFGRVLREVAKSGGPIYVERDGKPVAVILSVHEYERTKRVKLPPARIERLTGKVTGLTVLTRDKRLAAELKFEVYGK
jgi:prevent-host-death family protein